MTGVTQAIVLELLAELVTPPTRILDVGAKHAPVIVFPTPTDLFGEEPVPADPSRFWSWEQAQINALWSRDRLTPGEHGLRFGFGFVSGRTNKGRVFAPLVSVAVRPVANESFREGALGLAVRHYEPAGDVLSSSLIDDPDLANAVLDGLTFGVGDISPTMDDSDWDANADLRTWLTAAASAMGFEAKAIPPPTELRALRGSPEFVVSPVGAFYLEPPVERTGRAFDLASWGPTVQQTPRNAFGALYTAEGSEAAGDEAGEVDVSVVPLDADQRRAVENARSKPVSVIVGPPGTGKSHTVAAAAVDALERDERVLLATRSQHAASVLIDFLREAGAPQPIVFGDNQSRADLAADLWERVSSGARDRGVVGRFTRALVARGVRRDQAIAALDAESTLSDGDIVARILSEERRDVDLVAAERQLTVLDDPESGWWARRKARKALDRIVGPDQDGLRRRIAADHLKRDGGLALGPLIDDHIAVEQSLRQLFGAMLRSRVSGPTGRRERAALLDLARALRAGRTKRRQILAQIDSGALMRGAPLWVGTIDDVEDLLPREAGLFDLVIIDEASQVAQTSAPGALLRGKRLVAVGDANQLRHTSFLSDEVLSRTIERAGLAGTSLESLLDLRRNSLLDVAASTGVTVELSTHYRSNPHLIDFSARRFYGGRVQPATRHPGRDMIDCIDVVRVDGERYDGSNRREADEVIARIKSLLDCGFDGTVGVVTPFRAQADLLTDRVVEVFTPEQADRLRLAVGTVHSFQGAERDHMLISLAVDDDSAGGSFAFVEGRNLFNVMVTRARSQLTVVTSLKASRRGLIGDYLAHAERVQPPPPEQGAAGRWTAQLETFLRDQDLTVRAGYRVGHEVVDLVVGDGDKAVALDCEVHPEGPLAHIERRTMLDTLGWTVVDAFESRWGDRLAEFAIQFRHRDLG